MRRLHSGLVLGTLAVLTTAATPAPTAWEIDAAHTAIKFGVRHFFTPVDGRFEEFDVSLTWDRENPANSTVRVNIPVSSISTGNRKRDDHLRSGDFFEATAHPAITFESESVKAISDTELLVRGPLTIKGRTKIIEFPVTVLGVMDVAPAMRDMLGAEQIASFRASLSLDRRDFGVGVGNWAETAIVGSNVDIEIAVEANR